LSKKPDRVGKVEYIFKSLYVRSIYVYVINYMNYFYWSPFPPIRHHTRFDIYVEERNNVNFREQYFDIWQQVWRLHKKYFGISADDEQKWQQLDKECEQLHGQYKNTPQQKFVESLLLSVIAELERESKHEQRD